MAQTESVDSRLTRNSLDMPYTHDYETLSSFHRLSLVYGLLIGMAIAAGFWVPKLFVLARLPLWFPYGGAIVSSTAVILLCGLTGWLTGHLRYTVLVVLSWLVTAVLICHALGSLPPFGQNWAIWLLDGRFAKLPITPAPDHLLWWYYVIAGFLLIILLTLMAVLQNFNLVRAHQELVNGRRLNLQTSLILLIPALLAGGIGALFPDLSTSAPRDALVITDQAIERVRNFEGDLFQLSRDTGFNYNALASVADQLAGPYTLEINEVTNSWSSAVVTAHFDSGAWINCNVNIDQQHATYLSFCFDAAIPFTDGLNHLLLGQIPADTCRRCEVTADPIWEEWLQMRASQLGDNPMWQRVGQHGRFVFMQASNAESGFTISCQLEGSEDISLMSCEELPT